MWNQFPFIFFHLHFPIQFYQFFCSAWKLFAINFQIQQYKAKNFLGFHFIIIDRNRKKYVSQFINFYAAVRETNLRRLSNSHKRKTFQKKNKKNSTVVKKLLGEMWQRNRNTERWNLLMCQEMNNVVVMLENSKICLEFNNNNCFIFISNVKIVR